MTNPLAPVSNVKLSDLPDDALMHIMDKIDSSSPGTKSRLKGGALATFALAEKKIHTLFKETLKPRDELGAPQFSRGKDWERKMAKSFLKRAGSFEGLVCNWVEEQNGELVTKQSNWLIEDPKTQIEAVRYGQLEWENWRDLDPCLKTDPEFVLKQIFSSNLSIEDLWNFSSGTELRALFGLSEGERITIQNLSRMSMMQCKIASLYALARLQTDRAQPIHPANFAFTRHSTSALEAMYEGIFSKLFTRPDFDFSEQFLGILLKINPQFGHFFPNDENILRKIVEACPRFYTELNSEWQRTESIALVASKHNSNYIKIAGTTLLHDEAFLLAAISNNSQIIRHVPISLRNKASFMAQACQINEECFKYIGMELEHNPLFFQNISPFIQNPEIKTKFDKKRARAC